MISHDHRCIFVHIPRTGGTSIELALTNKDWFSADAAAKHLSVDLAKDLYRAYWDDYFTFSVVRNPFDRLVSIYMNLYPWGNLLFSDFILNGHWYADWEQAIDNQIDIIDGVDKIYRFEDLNGAWSDISRRIGVTLPLPHANLNIRQKDWSGYYTHAAGSREHIEKRCWKDLEAFGYSF